MSYSCPFSVKLKQFPFLVCKKSMQNDKDYSILENAVAVYCAHQRFCSCKQRVINTEEAEKCFKYQSSK